MKKTVVIPMVVAAAGGLLFAAVRYDRASNRAAEREQFEKITAEVERQEERFITHATALSDPATELNAEIERYRTARTEAEQRAAFERLSAAVQRALVSISASDNPAARRAMDEIHGALNRRSILLPEYEAQQRRLAD